ncbi:MAG: M20 family metallopeptidase [Deltaproteobacteria bacterium]|nr:MAG: M20 family metallopeptidase [Deltaproteobacteria bacterium]
MLPPGFLDAARALVRADTVSAHGTRAAVDALAPLYEAAGLALRRQVVREGSVEHVNALAGPGGTGSGAADPSRTEVPGGLLLVTHLDTVPSGPPEAWTRTAGDPWALTEEGGTLYGLGCADVKLDALCKIEAARRLRETRLRRPFWLLGTFGEEVGLKGARHFAGSELFEEIRPRQVLCGEPSKLELISAHKGYVVVRCTVADDRARLVSTAGPGIEELTFAGKAAHSSTPHLGVNAIRRAIAWARASGAAIASAKGGSSPNVVPARCQIEVPAPRENGEPRPDAARFLPPGPPRPNLWRPLVTAGALEDLWLTLLGEAEPRADARFDPPGAVGGLNVLESEASEAGTEAIYARGAIHATFDGRLLPEHDPDALLARFEERARMWVRELGQGELSLRIEATRNARGMSLAGDAELLRGAGSALREMGLDPSPRAKPTSTEAGVFARKGCEAAVFGPGVSTGNAHTPNERIEIAQLEKAIDAYQRIVLELCGRAT